MSDDEFSSNDFHVSDDDLEGFPEEDMKFEVDEVLDGEGEEDEEEEDEEEEYEVKCVVKDLGSEVLQGKADEDSEHAPDKWTASAVARLLARMKSALAGTDNDNTFDSYVEQDTLDWEKIAFRPYSADDCKEKWAKDSKDLRRFRFLTELVDEVAASHGVELGRRSPTDPLDDKSFEAEDASCADPPSKPQTALQLFVSSVRDKLEQQNKSRHITANAYSHIVKSWKKQPEKERIVFIRRSMEFWKEYERKAEEYVKENPRYKPFQCTVTKEERALLDKVSGKPARPAGSPYVMFLQDTLPTLKHHQPKNRMAVISRMWSELEEEKKAVYQEKFNEVQKEYRKALVNYEMKPIRRVAAKRKLDETLEGASSSKSTAVVAAENPPRAAFEFFSKMAGPAIRSSLTVADSDDSEAELQRRLAEIWENLTPTEKSVYEAKEQTAYEDSTGACATASSSTVPDAEEAERAKLRIARQLMAGAPKKPPSCAYHLFLRETYPKLTDLPQKERTRLLAKHWTTLPPEAKKPFALRTAEMQREYEKAFAEFLETIPPETREIVKSKAITRRKNARKDKRGGKTEPLLGESAGEVPRENSSLETSAGSVASSEMALANDDDNDDILELELEEEVEVLDSGTRLTISIGAEENGYASDTETESGEEDM